MMRRTLLALAALLTGLLAATAQAALLGRVPLTPGGTDYQAWYDDVNDITWLADANYARTSGYSATGNMSWDQSLAFVAFLNDLNHLGVSDWRLPMMLDYGNDGCPGLTRLDRIGTDCGYNTITATAEMSSMFYDTLGNPAFYDLDGNQRATGEYGLLNAGPFINLDAGGLYWYGLENVTNPDAAWYFGMPSGGQGPRGKIAPSPSWQVRDGDIALALIPLPGGLVLLAGALGLLLGVRRRS